jgi:ABC-type glycerol-3-phosphate transport system permease component
VSELLLDSHDVSAGSTLAIITFLQTWNNYLWPLTVLRREEVMTLPVGMASMLSGVSAGSAPPFGPGMAASILVSVPIIFVFVYVQKYYIAGLTAGAVKG